MHNKRGGLASLMSLAVATIVIVIVLIGFIAVSAIVKKIEKIENGEKIYKDKEVGVGDVDAYMENYALFLETEKLVKKGDSVDDALSSSGYEIGDINIQYGGSYG